jgi:phage gpG-like protein
MGAVKEFEDLALFAVHLTSMQIALRKSLHRGLESALVLLEKDMKAQIGHYQGEVGEFPAWAPLADSTEAEKQRLGAPLGAPLLRHGGMYASFQHESKDDEGVVGSTDPTLIYHEFGTSKMPPRPVVGPALVRNRDKIQQLLGRALVEGILGGEIAAGGAAYFGGDITP